MIPHIYFRDGPRFGKDSVLLFQYQGVDHLGRVSGLYDSEENDRLFMRVLLHEAVSSYSDATEHVVCVDWLLFGERFISEISLHDCSNVTVLSLLEQKDIHRVVGEFNAIRAPSGLLFLRTMSM